MKKLFLFLVLFFTTSTLFTQNKINTCLYFTGGYNAASSQFDGLSFVFNRYNELRPALIKKLETPPYLHGYSAGIGLTYGRLFAEFLYQQKKSPVQSAESSAGNTREYKMQMNSYNIGAGCSFLKRGPVEFSLGVSVDVIKMNQYTRVYGKTGTVPDFYDIDLIASGTTNTFSAFTFFPQAELKLPALKGFTFTARPYYQVFLSKMDYAGTNEELNYNTYLADSQQITSGKLNNFGFLLRVSYYMLF